MQGVGKVETNGPGASKYSEGQRVVGLPWPVMEGRGTWQQYVVVKEESLVSGWKEGGGGMGGQGGGREGRIGGGEGEGEG